MSLTVHVSVSDALLPVYMADPCTLSSCQPSCGPVNRAQTALLLEEVSKPLDTKYLCNGLVWALTHTDGVGADLLMWQCGVGDANDKL